MYTGWFIATSSPSLGAWVTCLLVILFATSSITSSHCKTVIIPRNKKSWQANFGISNEVRVLHIIHIHMVTLMEFLIPQAWDQIISRENYPITKYSFPATEDSSGMYDIIYYRIIRVFIREGSPVIKEYLYYLRIIPFQSGVFVKHVQIPCSLACTSTQCTTSQGS
jgi:hypothetical protein